MAPNIGIVLSGCGVMDGSEIHEAVCTLLALDKAGCQVTFLAPDVAQRDVVDHAKGAEAKGERRNVLTEAARIARGNIQKLTVQSARPLDAAIFPGGYGAAKNLCDYASKQDKCTVQPDVAAFIETMYEQKKPLGFLCIAPVIAAKFFGSRGIKVSVTVGSDASTGNHMNAMGAQSVPSTVTTAVVDKPNRIVSTACYMLATRPSEVLAGAEAVVKEILELLKK